MSKPYESKPDEPNAGEQREGKEPDEGAKRRHGKALQRGSERRDRDRRAADIARMARLTPEEVAALLKGLH